MALGTAQNDGLANGRNQDLVDILVAQGGLTPERGKEVKLAEVQSGKTQEQILTNQDLVTEDALVKAKAVLYNIEFVDVNSSPAAPDALGILPQQVAEKFRVIPLSADKTKKELIVAMADPLDLSAIEFIEQKTGYRVKPKAGVPTDITATISSRYASSLSSEVTQVLKETSRDGDASNRVVDLAQIGQVIREAPVAKIVSTVLEFAMKSRASDVHIEPQENRTRVRYRIDGILNEKLSLPKQVHESLISRIKILGGDED